MTGFSAPGSHQLACWLSREQARSRSRLMSMRSGNSSKRPSARRSSKNGLHLFPRPEAPLEGSPHGVQLSARHSQGIGASIVVGVVDWHKVGLVTGRAGEPREPFLQIRAVHWARDSCRIIMAELLIEVSQCARRTQWSVVSDQCPSVTTPDQTSLRSVNQRGCPVVSKIEFPLRLGSKSPAMSPTAESVRGATG